VDRRTINWTVVEIFKDHSTRQGIEVFTVRVDDSDGATRTGPKLIGRGRKIAGPHVYWCRLASAAVEGLSAEGKVCLAKSSSASRRTASLVGFFILSQYGDRPEI
jgi:hypothetical protein